MLDNPTDSTINLPPPGDLIPDLQVVDNSTAEDGDGNGFILAVSGSDVMPRVTFFARRVAGPSQATPSAEARARAPLPFDEEYEAEPGSYDLQFQAEGGHLTPAPLTVTVRPGLGTILLVHYYTRDELAMAAREHPEQADEIKKLLCSAAPTSAPAPGPDTASEG